MQVRSGQAHLAAIYSACEGEELLEGSISTLRRFASTVIAVAQTRSSGDPKEGGLVECRRLLRDGSGARKLHSKPDGATGGEGADPGAERGTGGRPVDGKRTIAGNGRGGPRDDCAQRRDGGGGFRGECRGDGESPDAVATGIAGGVSR